MLYSLRPEHSLCPALSAVFEAEKGRFQAMLAGINDAAKATGPGLAAPWLFGSVARGEDRTDSDLDLALVADPGSQTGGDCRSGAAGLADVFHDGVAALAERAGFTRSVATLITGDVAKLSAEHDPWWLQVHLRRHCARR